MSKRMTDHVRRALESIGRSPKPAQEFNAGVVDKITREHQAEIFSAPTPYPSRKGNIQWLRITQAGHDALAAELGPKRSKR